MNYNNLQKVKILSKPTNRVDRYIQTKSLAEVPKDVLKDVRLVSLSDQEQGIPFGSYMNRIADVFGDIDVIQLVDNFKSASEIGPKTAKAIQEMVRQVDKAHNRWFSEFKAGIDERYFFDIGQLLEGRYYMAEDLLKRSERLYKDNMLTQNEIGLIKTVSKKIIKNGDDYDMVFNLFRDHYVLRWTQDEVLQGYKMLPKNKKYKLENAVTDRAAVKIDVIMFEDRFMEVTNFMTIAYKKNGKLVPVNFDPVEVTPANLPVAIEQLYYSNWYYKPFKMVKRAFAYLKWLRKNSKEEDLVVLGFNKYMIDTNILKYGDILKKSINILYTITSELEAMEIVYDKKEITKKIVKQRLNELKQPLSNVLELSKEALSEIVSYMDSENPDIKVLIKTFKSVIDYWTIYYFQEANINPPPLIVLPEERRYDPNLIRKV